VRRHLETLLVLPTHVVQPHAVLRRQAGFQLALFCAHWLHLSAGVLSRKAEVNLLPHCAQVGVRLGQGERLPDILASSSQVAEGVATAGSPLGRLLSYGVMVGLGHAERVCTGWNTTLCRPVANIPVPASPVGLPALLFGPTHLCCSGCSRRSPVKNSSAPAAAAVVVNLARKYRVQLPVLTAVAQVCWLGWAGLD